MKYDIQTSFELHIENIPNWRHRQIGNLIIVHGKGSWLKESTILLTIHSPGYGRRPSIELGNRFTTFK